MSRTPTTLRNDILAEARRVLVEEGYPKLSMRRVARAVGCTATSIYLYWANKDALVHSLIDDGMERLHNELTVAMEGAGEPAERLERYARAFIAFGLENPEFYEVMFLLSPEMDRFPPELYRRARRNLELAADVLGERDPSPSASDRLAAATVVWSTLHGAVSLLLGGRVDSSLDRAAFVDRVVQHVALLASPPARHETPAASSNGRAKITSDASRSDASSSLR